ncbi:MAG TPA: hypothetical protein VHZ33_04665 [Trebonia sp.]|nr:hypothetical protein [Trebonia sp.]
MSVGLAVLAGAAWIVPAGAATEKAAVPTGVRLSAGPLGIDVAPWTNPASLTALRPQLEAAHVTQIHYGGGTTADEYDWENDADISDCTPLINPADYAKACAHPGRDALKFSTFSAQARAIHAQSMATVNFGTGQPSWAADLVKRATTTSGQQVSDYEIGNENYGCWEPNQYIAGYQPNDNAVCPMATEGVTAGMTEVATSYATHAATIMADMKAVNANAQLVVPYANDDTVGGASVDGNTIWNNTVIGDDAQYIGAVDEHWYDWGFVGNTSVGGNPSAQQVIQSVETIPTQDAKIKASLAANGDPTAKVIVGETGVSFQDTNVPCTPAGALFAAGDVLEWLSQGAVSVDWWPLNTDSNLHYTTSDCKPDEAMFTNPATGTPQPLSPYTGYLLASQLAQPNAQLAALTTSNGQVLGFQSTLPNGQIAVALINTNTSTAERVTAGTSLTGELAEETYSAGNQNAANTKTVSGTTTANAVNAGITMPRESIVILKTLRPSAMALTAGSTYKAGTKVTLKGKLTLDGGAAPAGVTVKITRVRSGSKADGGTFTAKTVAGGTFTATNIPPATGTYVYRASYGTSVWAPSSHSVTVRITAAKPALRLAVSAKTVRPGRNVTVTATLAAPHVNRTLSIYAQPRGGAKKLIKRGAINSKDQVGVAYTIRANTTFTVTFSGDTWYTSASATAAVKS